MEKAFNEASKEGNTSRNKYVVQGAKDYEADNLMAIESIEKNMIKIYEFNEDEYEGLLSAFNKKKYQNNDNFFTSYNVQVKIPDFEHLRNGSCVTKNSMSFILKYFENFQLSEKNSKEKGNNCFFFGVYINTFERFEKKASYTTISSTDTELSPLKLSKLYDKVIIVAFYD